MDILKQKQLLLQLTRELTQGIVGGKPLPAKSKKKSEADRVPDFNTLFDAMEKHSQNPLVQSESMNQEQGLCVRMYACVCAHMSKETTVKLQFKRNIMI